MRPNISRGRLHPEPRTVEEALERFKQICHEMDKIRGQLADPGRILRYPVAADYDSWRGSAQRALNSFRLEEKLTTEWIARPPLFRAAYDLLSTLEVETDFEDDETALMVKLDEHFGNRHEEKKTA